MRTATKPKATREKKTRPATRGYGDPRAVGGGKYDPQKHPRDERGHFIHTGGAGKTAKATGTKAAKPPKPPKKQGSPAQRKGLADQIRAAKGKATTPEAKKALLEQVRALRARRQETSRVSKLKPVKTPKPKVEKPPKPPKEPKAPKVKAEKTHKAKPDPESKAKAKAAEVTYATDRLKDLHGKGAATTPEQIAAEVKAASKLTHAQLKDVQGNLGITAAGKTKAATLDAIKGHLEGEVARAVAARTAAASSGDLREHAAAIKDLRPSEQKAKLLEFIEANKGPATAVREHGMDSPEPMSSIKYGDHTFHFPDTEAGRLAAAGTARALLLGGEMHPELARHTRNIYHTSQANSHDAVWKVRFNDPDHVSAATGGDGNVVVYGGHNLGVGLFAHEAGHNLAAARYGSINPRGLSAFADVAGREPRPTEYARNSLAEDFAESVMLYTEDHVKFQRTNPLRHRVIKRLLEDRTYGG